MADWHERKCWECGNLQMCKERVVPHVTCNECGSNDTRATKRMPIEKNIFREQRDEAIALLKRWLAEVYAVYMPNELEQKTYNFIADVEGKG